MGDHEYRVYLVPSGKRGRDQNIVSPVHGTEVEFYENGVWLTRKNGRNFFPYDQVRTIREHRPGEGPTEESTAEQETASTDD